MTLLYDQLQVELAAQTGPLGLTTPGAPVAVLDIPSIGITDTVVVEGTTPENQGLSVNAHGFLMRADRTGPCRPDPGGTITVIGSDPSAMNGTEMSFGVKCA